MNNLSQAITILSAMITPVVLILASGSLILTTSQRLSRVIERTRKLTGQLKEIGVEDMPDDGIKRQSEILFVQLDMATRRARLLQRAMTSLYLTISVFLATSISIAIVDITDSIYTWIPIALGIIGASLLFYASLVLINESRIALSAVDHEMKQAILLFQHNFPKLAKEDKRKWWKHLIQNNKTS
jgi:uncharacterized membrane protein YoaK (UPF0700 family)